MLTDTNTLAFYTITAVKKFYLFATVSHFHPGLIITSKTGTYHSGAFNVAPVLAEIIRLGWKMVTVTNPLAY
jgi:hypothetical protein